MRLDTDVSCNDSDFLGGGMARWIFSFRRSPTAFILGDGPRWFGFIYSLGGGRVRGWNVEQARVVFRTGVIGLLIILMVFIVWGRVIGANLSNPVWGQEARKYSRIETALLSLGATPENIVLVNNAPGYYVVNVRPVISIPNGEEQTSLVVARRYGARYLLLEKNHPQGLSDLYKHPIDLPGLDFLLTVENTHIFRVEP